MNSTLLLEVSLFARVRAIPKETLKITYSENSISYDGEISLGMRIFPIFPEKNSEEEFAEELEGYVWRKKIREREPRFGIVSLSRWCIQPPAARRCGCCADWPSSRARMPPDRDGQTLQGSFSAGSKRNFASKYALESSRRDLHNALFCTALKSIF